MSVPKTPSLNKFNANATPFVPSSKTPSITIPQTPSSHKQISTQNDNATLSTNVASASKTVLPTPRFRGATKSDMFLHQPSKTINNIYEVEQVMAFVHVLLQYVNTFLTNFSNHTKHLAKVSINELVSTQEISQEDYSRKFEERVRLERFHSSKKIENWNSKAKHDTVAEIEKMDSTCKLLYEITCGWYLYTLTIDPTKEIRPSLSSFDVFLHEFLVSLITDPFVLAGKFERSSTSKKVEDIKNILRTVLQRCVKPFNGNDVFDMNILTPAHLRNRVGASAVQQHVVAATPKAGALVAQTPKAAVPPTPKVPMTPKVAPVESSGTEDTKPEVVDFNPTDIAPEPPVQSEVEPTKVQVPSTPKPNPTLNTTQNSNSSETPRVRNNLAIPAGLNRSVTSHTPMARVPSYIPAPLITNKTSGDLTSKNSKINLDLYPSQSTTVEPPAKHVVLKN